jgi:hypothetical protein
MKLLNTMRHLMCLATGLCLLMTTTGCPKRPPRPVAPATAVRTAPSPATSASARINFTNLENRFVVVEFTSGTMPAIGTRLKLYRSGKPVGTVQITEPTRGRFATADILDGEPRAGDEVR